MYKRCNFLKSKNLLTQNLMTQNKNQHIIYLDVNNLYGLNPKSTRVDSNGSILKNFDLNKDINNSSKRCVLEVDLEYPKKYPPGKIETKREMLSEYQLKIADVYNIPIGNVKNWCLTFLTKKNMYFIMKTSLETRIKLKNTSRIRI